jgi:hypothetical protein
MASALSVFTFVDTTVSYTNTQILIMEGRGFESRWGGIFHPSSRTMALGGKGRPARKADNLTAICEPIV